jgi:hypothetical protein
MTKPQAEPSPLTQRLTRYLQLEIDAVDAYAIAARELGELDAVEVVGQFRKQHEAQRDELSRLVRDAGGEGYDPFRPRRPVTREGYLLGACSADGPMFSLLHDGEWARMIEYESALRQPVADASVRNALERGYFGSRTRLRWLEARARPAQRAAAGALPSRRRTAR